MIKLAAQAMTTVGVVLLVMSVLVRLASLSAASRVGDDLAIGTSVIVVLLGAVVSRYWPERGPASPPAQSRVLTEKRTKS